MDKQGDVAVTSGSRSGRRTGLTWTEADYRVLEDGIRAGADEEALAALVGRTLGAVRSRVRAMLGRAGEPYIDPFGTLRVLAAEGRLDMLGMAAGLHQDRGLALWQEGTAEVLRSAWDQGAPTLTVLADTLGVTEVQVVRQLMEANLASSTLAAYERLGTDDELGAVAVRARLAADKASCMVWTLTLWDDQGRHVHSSVCPSRTWAEDELQTIRTRYDERMAAGEPVGHWTWVLACRVPGEGSVREDVSGSFLPQPTTHQEGQAPCP